MFNIIIKYHIQQLHFQQQSRIIHNLITLIFCLGPETALLLTHLLLPHPNQLAQTSIRYVRCGLLDGALVTPIVPMFEGRALDLAVYVKKVLRLE